MSRNVVLILLDSVRKDYFDRYAPRLQAASDVSFEQCRAASAWSTPSHASILTGELPHEHGIHTHQRSFSALDREETVVGSLDGYESIGVSANVYAGSAYGFDTVFDEFVDVNPRIRYPGSWDDLRTGGRRKHVEFVARTLRADDPWKRVANGLSIGLRSRFERLPFPSPYDDGAVPILRAAKREVERANEPLFLVVNFMDVHQPLTPHLGFDRTLHSVRNDWTSRDDFYEVKWDVNYRRRIEEHEEYLSNYRELYRAAVEYLDRRVSTFVETIDRLTENETVFLVTADHGENLAYETDGYYFEHTGTLTEALLHVPFCLINPPPGYDRTVTEYFSHLRTGQLIAGMAADRTPDVFDERIAAEVIGLSPGASSLGEEGRDEMDRMIRAAYDRRCKFVWDSTGSTEAYDLDPASPSTERRVSEAVTIPPWAKRLFDGDVREYKSAVAGGGQSQRKLDAQTRDRLDDLGYL